MKIPLGKPYIKKNIVLKKIGKVLDTKWISGGPTISKFENAIKKYNDDDSGYYIAVSNGTAALELSLFLANKGYWYDDFDEIIVPSWSWVASGFSVANVGAVPVWCDVNQYGVPFVEDIEKRITSRTRVIIIVHQMGIPCDLDSINNLGKKYKIPIIEDGACALGSEYNNIKLGKTENIFTYSFQARKVLTTGEGGMVIVREKSSEKYIRSLRAFGTNITPLEREKDTSMLDSFDEIGFNHKMSDINAAVGLAHLQYLDDEIKLRNMVADYYNEKIMKMINDGYSIELCVIPTYCTRWNGQNYHIVLGQKYHRNRVVEQMKKYGISCKRDIQATHLEPAIVRNFHTFLNIKYELPQTMKFHNHGMWLPFFPEMTKSEQDFVIEKLRRVLDEV